MTTEISYVKCSRTDRTPTSERMRSSIHTWGLGNFVPEGRKYGPPIPSNAHYPSDGNKLVPTLREALERAGLKDGMTISTHHHFRDGDLLANLVFDIAHEMGVKGSPLVSVRIFSLPCSSDSLPRRRND